MHSCNCKALDTLSCCNNEEEYEKFVPYKEYPVGGFFRIGNEVFKVVEDHTGDCFTCDSEYLTAKCYNNICDGLVRNDERYVKFILYDTLPENEN